MSFKNLNIPFQVNTTISNPVNVFFDPLLKVAKSYDVAVGYFSTAWIRDAATGIAALAANGGSSRWVISPSLSKEDWDLLSTSTNQDVRERVVEEATRYDIRELQQALEEDTRIALAWLIRDGVIKFKIAIPTNQLSGIFHAKIGIFTDFVGNKVAFSGSYNLTGAANTNWETIDVFLGWEDGDAKRVTTREQQFENIWNKTDPNLAVFVPSDALVAQFIEITEHSRRPYQLQGAPIGVGTDKPTPWIPPYFLNDAGKLRDHQESAIQNWFERNGRGIFQMATGSGKTVTALAVAAKLTAVTLKAKKKLVVVVAVPYKHLAEQWCKEATAFGFEPLICYESFDAWASEFQRKILELTLGIEDIAFFITVNATFSNIKFQTFLSTIDVTFLFIADEMHNMGGEAIRTVLPQKANFRLGLSATPDRHNDDEGTAIIHRYFGPVVAEYGIREAIDDRTLTRYFYYPVVVEFTAEEMEQYQELSAKIARNFAQNQSDQNGSSDVLKKLLIERARLIGNAENKIPVLRDLLSKRNGSKFNLVYCGDVISDGERSVDKTLKMIGNELGMRANKFTSTESSIERRAILEKFGSGEIQVIVAIRCLDEGVDIPRTETAYILASSTNPRQYIQRRGRVLRRASGKSFAHIYDFIVVPPLGKNLDDSSFNVERKLVRKELERVDEFVACSENSGDALQALRVVKVRLNLIDS
jgi:DNA phosphorothioation system restriction enzyme